MAKVGYSRSMSRFTASKLRKSFGDKFYGIVTGTSFEAGRAGGAFGCFRQSCSVLASAFLSSCLRSGDAGAIKIARDAAKRGGVSTKELAQMMRLEATGDRAGLRARPSKRVKEAPKEALKQLQKRGSSSRTPLKAQVLEGWHGGWQGQWDLCVPHTGYPAEGPTEGELRCWLRLGSLETSQGGKKGNKNKRERE